MKREELDKEVDIARFEGGHLVLGGRKDVPILNLCTKDGRQMQMTSNNLTLYALGHHSCMKVKVLIYDVITALMDVMKARVTKVVIYRASLQGKNRAKVHLIDADGKEHIVDAEPGHGIALAYRACVPMRITEENLSGHHPSSLNEQFRLLLGSDESILNYVRDLSQEDLLKGSVDSLNILLEKAIEHEEYQIAARLKQAIQTIGDTQ